MGTRYDEAYVKTIQDDIRLACKTLEELGFDSLMVITSPGRHMELGSAKGRSFIEAYPDYFEDFIEYCKVKVEVQYDPVAENRKSVSVPTVVIQPVTAGKSKQSKVFDPEPDIMDGIDGAFDDGDESGLEEEHSVYLDADADLDPIDIKQESDHTIDTAKIILRTSNKDGKKKTKAVKKKERKIKAVRRKVNAEFEVGMKVPVKVKAEKGPQEPVYCDTCGKSFNTRKALVIHQRLHTGETPYRCEKCGKGFRSSGLRASHMSFHSTEKRFTCETCGKAFQWRGSFNAHKRNAHTEERKHICDICGAGFKDANILKKHTMRHEGLRPNKCEKCGKSFIFPYGLKCHMKTHEPKTPSTKRFTCGICSTQFTAKNSAMKHLRTKHPHHVPIIYMIQEQTEDDDEEFMEDA